ncbi:MAG: PrsW family intramembrane metalloprotease [Anaerolineales bacterium]|nr:PrsW family intramembrane metalloprotease [Anaerolineales bacterium]
MSDNENLKDLLLALLAAAGILVGGLGAFCIATLTQWMPIEGMPGQREAQIWTALAMAAIALCGIPGLLIAARGFLDESRPHIQKPSRIWLLFLLFLPLAFLANYLAYEVEILPAILGPATNLLTAAFAVIVSIQLVLLYAPRISRRRFWGQFLTGLYAIPPSIMMLELAALIPIVMILTATLLSNGFSPFSPDFLMDPNFNPQSYWKQLDMETIFQPTSIMLLMVYLGLIVPLIEEFLKTFALWPVIRRITNPGEAYLAGALAGAGYGLFEALMLAQPGPSFLQVGLLRIGATFLHSATAALTSWGMFKALREKKWWIAPLSYGVAVLLHGLWNINAVVMSWLSLEEATEGLLYTLQQYHLDLLPPLVFLLLSAGTLVSLPWMANRTNRTNRDLKTASGLVTIRNNDLDSSW